MKPLLSSLIALLVSVIIFSCNRMILQSVGALDEKVKLKAVTNNLKEIVFIPVHHVGKQIFYEDVKHNIDSLKNLDYKFFYEGVKKDESLDSVGFDTIAMKLRHFLGIDMRFLMASKGHIDTVASTFHGKKMKLIKTENLVNQTSIVKWVDTAHAVRADVTYGELLAMFESKYGPQTLTQYDFDTRYTERYTAKIPKRKEKIYAMLAFRDSVITSYIIQDSSKKIAIIYGAKHYEGVLKNLQAIDSNWTELKHEKR